MHLVIAVLIAVFLSLRGAGRGLSSFGARASYDRIKANDAKRLAEWQAKVADEELETDLKERLENQDSELLEEIRSSWAEYFGTERTLDEVRILANREKIYALTGVPASTAIISGRQWYIGKALKGEISFENAMRILMSNRGRVRKDDWTYGINYRQFDGYGTEISHVQTSNFVKTMNRKLREHGINEEMYVESPPEYLRVQENWTVRTSGRIYWEPMISEVKLDFSRMWIERYDSKCLL